MLPMMRSSIPVLVNSKGHTHSNMDDEGFWKPLSLILYIAMPLTKLLRALDGTKPVLGKVYYRMFLVQERLEALKAEGIVPWADAMISIYKDRWKYLHSDFHSAAYALDPEFMEHGLSCELGRWIRKSWMASAMCLRRCAYKM